MKYSEHLGTKIIKRFYGITGPLDEYRYQEITRIGNNAFIFLWIYLMISNLVAVCFGLLNAEVTLYVYVSVNVFVTIFGISAYIIWESKRKQLTKIDVEDIDIHSFKKKMIISTIIGASMYGLMMFVFNSLMAVRFDDNTEFFKYLFSKHNIILSIIQMVGFGVIIYLFQLYRLKKSEKAACEEEI